MPAVPSPRHLRRLAARIERAEAAAGGPAPGLLDEAKARISLMLGSAGAVSERHRRLLADPARRPTPAGAARLLEWGKARRCA